MTKNETERHDDRFVAGSSGRRKETFRSLFLHIASQKINSNQSEAFQTKKAAPNITHKKPLQVSEPVPYHCELVNGEHQRARLVLAN